MKKIALALALTAITPSARANWSPVDASPADRRLYLNLQTAEKSAPQMVLLWHVIDHADVQSRDGKDFRSQMLRNEYDCDKSMVREMFRSWHKGAMASGMTVYWTEGRRQWLAPEPGSLDETLARAACASLK